MSDAPALVHPTAAIDPDARLGTGVQVGAYAVIGAGVEIGDGTRIGPHCTIEGPTRIGRENVFHAHAAIGGEPIVWLLRLALRPPLPWRAISSALTMPKNGSVGTPPYSSGNPSCIRPAAEALR